MKEKIIELLSTKNEKKERIFDFSPSIVPTKPWKYSSQEKMRYYLWLCQLQKWIAEKYMVFIYCTPTITYNGHTDVKWTNNLDVRENKYFNTIDEALESGVYEALTDLIKKI